VLELPGGVGVGRLNPLSSLDWSDLPSSAKFQHSQWSLQSYILKAFGYKKINLALNNLQKDAFSKLWGGERGTASSHSVIEEGRHHIRYGDTL